MDLIDRAQGTDGINTVQGISLHDSGHWKAQWKIRKFKDDESFARRETYEEVEFEPNLLANAGINALLTLLAGGGGTAFNNTNAYLGVGDSSTAATATQTDLQAATNKLRVAMNASYPIYGTSQQIVFQSNFGSSQGNYAWEEFGTFNASTSGTMLNRLVSSQGTKISGQTWQLTLTVTLS
ncbi:MAG: hypothetical protein ACRDFB_07180 [Rhabdochlamydiaceae bacterium]